MPTIQHYEFTCGDTPSITLTVTNGGVAYNLTGYAASFIMRERGPSGTVKITKTTSDYISIATPSSGVMVIAFVAGDTDTLAAGTYWYEVEITSGANVYTVASGYINLLADGA